MISGFLATLAGSAWARPALRYGVTALAVLLFLLALRRSGERAGRLVERLKTMEKVHDVQRRMLEAAARRPSSRDDLAERLHDARSYRRCARHVSLRRCIAGRSRRERRGTELIAGRFGYCRDAERLRRTA